ncbi:SPOR domain-containing protein [Lutibacter sp.]|uniref:HU domain-containing protein n=1 Tax=Lutibacter sp. TaxID=1925666 RepID=UPI0025B80249|nr:SPOR domain-containing protein [Lutibacter sp.]
MTLANYISDLLYRYECVIVPNFGGFITNKISAKVNNFTHTFYAPSKQLTFNSHLQNNDGLLANYIASVKNISYAEAILKIENEVKNWELSLKKDELELENIGSFHLNEEKKIIFEPANVNYLTSSFGLSSFVSPAIKRVVYQEKVKQLETVVPIFHTKENNSKTPVFIKYAAAAAILFTLGTVGWKEYQKFEYNNLVAQSEQQQKNVEKTIQEATFVIENPLPAITLSVTKQTNNYHIIAGAFREPGNAKKKLQQLLQKGFNAQILDVNKWNLTPVAFESFNSKKEAINKLKIIKKTESKAAWLLVKKY